MGKHNLIEDRWKHATRVSIENIFLKRENSPFAWYVFPYFYFDIYFISHYNIIIFYTVDKLNPIILSLVKTRVKTNSSILGIYYPLWVRLSSEVFPWPLVQLHFWFPRLWCRRYPYHLVDLAPVTSGLPRQLSGVFSAPECPSADSPWVGPRNTLVADWLSVCSRAPSDLGRRRPVRSRPPHVPREPPLKNQIIIVQSKFGPFTVRY